MKNKRWLKFWFKVHFAADFIAAVPLFVFPEQALRLLGWQTFDPLAARLVAAALFGIGIESLIGSFKDDSAAFREMLNLKILWSFFAMAGIVVSIYQGGYSNRSILWLLFGIFALFHFLWLFFRIRLK